MNELLTILALSWFTCIVIEMYLNLCFKAKIKPRKPFGCQKCLGFWFGLIFYTLNILIYENFNLENIGMCIIFALLTSFTTTILYALYRRL